MPSLADLQPIDENDPVTAQILLGDNPKFRAETADTACRLRELVGADPTPERLAWLAEVERAYDDYRADPVWAGAALQRLWDAMEPLTADPLHK